MMIHRKLTLAAGLNSLSALLTSVFPAFLSLTLDFPPTNAGSVAVGGPTMAAVTDGSQYGAGESMTYEGGGGAIDGSQIYLYAASAGDVVIVRGNNLA